MPATLSVSILFIVDFALVHKHFQVLIPDIKEFASEYVTTAEEHKAFGEPNHSPSLSLAILNPLPEELYSFNGDDEQGPSLSQDSIKDVAEVEEYLINGDPRIPRPTDIPAELRGNGQAFHTERVSNARKSVGEFPSILAHSKVSCPLRPGAHERRLAVRQIWPLCESVFSTSSSGHDLIVLLDRPELHPLAEIPVHNVMRLYDDKGRPGCLARVFSNSEHLDTHLGRAIREFASVIGILDDAWAALLRNHVVCKCCQCAFSVDGYHSHIVGGKCSMAPPMDKGRFSLSSCCSFLRHCSSAQGLRYW